MPICPFLLRLLRRYFLWFALDGRQTGILPCSLFILIAVGGASQARQCCALCGCLHRSPGNQESNGGNEEAHQQKDSSYHNQHPIELANKNGLGWMGGIIPAWVTLPDTVAIDNRLLGSTIRGIGI